MEKLSLASPCNRVFRGRRGKGTGEGRKREGEGVGRGSDGSGKWWDGNEREGKGPEEDGAGGGRRWVQSLDKNRKSGKFGGEYIRQMFGIK